MATARMGIAILFEFVGVMDVLEIGIECLPRQRLWIGIYHPEASHGAKNKIFTPEAD